METFWVTVILVLSTFGLGLYYLKKALRKWLKVEKKSMFSYNHVNDTHRKLDWTIRISFMLLLISGLFINIERIPLEPLWYLQTHIIMFGFIIVTETVRAIMEKRYAENKNDYLFTLFQLGVIVVFLLSLFLTNFFWLL
ncbi:DUF4181 domain-containing protein [Bacillus sp. es.036]|uniref:DUF4181 domain-containing protein n=1 Tax=Bacillus sp. es.036 TaxID=1761764 RepID=UPI000BF5139A|nr:DUF4181 domain-containing protein [Bacillus sp. es.036]PFG12205.1 uncharacterized protein DUF4181 [Bacillus sp. es.036]